MTIEKKLLATNPVSGEVLPEAVSFDGATDYLSRSSDLTGNSDGKTFTFSCWFYQVAGDNGDLYSIDTGSTTQRLSIFVTSSGEFGFLMRDSSAGLVLYANKSQLIAGNTFNHLLISIDMTNTSNRYVYLNDNLVAMSWNNYNNLNINFSSAGHGIGARGYDGNNKLKGRLSNLFLDYTYRDLSTTSNRRLFITADGKPSDTIPSNPILYLPMKGAATAGSNSGTGGDFTVNGVLATAERGPNQDNCSASNFDGSNDYMDRASITGISDGKVVTCAFVIQQKYSGGNYIINFHDSVEVLGHLSVTFSGGGDCEVYAYDVSHTQILNVSFNLNTGEATSHGVAISFDLSDTSKRHLFVDGVDRTSTGAWNTYTNANISYTSANGVFIAAQKSNNTFEGDLGEVYFNTSYTDLATENPFWDSDANRPNSVRKVIEDTGVTPLIALPMIGSDAGNNLGSGGDFTVNSGPFTGARGGSEFWARSVAVGTSKYLTKTNPSTLSNSSTYTLMFSFRTTYGGSQTIFSVDNPNSHSNGLTVMLDNTSGVTNYVSYNSYYNGNNRRANFHVDNTNSRFTHGNWNTVLVSVDTSNTNTFKAFINRTEVTPSNMTSVNAVIGFTGHDIHINRGNGAAQDPCEVANVYFSTTYTDFSQEATLNKFLDQLGYPKDLTDAISDGDIDNPIVYLKFNDLTNFGANGGTGGDLTVSGSVIQDGDVNPYT